jgi:hypothetical protein
MYDSIIKKLKNNPITASFILLAVLVGGLSSMTESFRRLASTAIPFFEPSIDEFAGIWLIEETEEMPKIYIFLEVINNKLYGNTKIKLNDEQIISFRIKQKSRIYDVRVDGDVIEFKTRRTMSTFAGGAKDNEWILEFRGVLENGSIAFSITRPAITTVSAVAKRLSLEEGKKSMDAGF